MSKERSRILNRLLAAFLSLIMVFSIIPFSKRTSAATTGHPDCITITVNDENGVAIKDASVEITVDSVTKGDNYISETKTTEEDGVVEVIAKADYTAGDLTLTAKVNAAGFATDTTTIANTAITTDDQNFEVTLVSTKISDVTIEGKSLTYTGKEQELVSVTKIDGDTVTYEVDGGTPTAVIPSATNVCEHQIKVTVKRDGKADLVKTVTGKINKADITGISIEGKNIAYNEIEQEIVTLNGSLEDSDTVTWSVNTVNTGSRAIPSATAVGTYKVVLTVDRGSNYNKLVTDEVTTNIIEGELNLEGLSVSGLEGTYTVENGAPVAQPAVTVTNKGDYDLKYQLDDGDLTVNDSAWVDTIPTVTNAGSYIIWVKATKDYYNDSDVEVKPATSAVAPYNVYVAKAPQSLEFVHTVPTEVTIDETTSANNIYDFAASGENLSGQDIKYSLIDASGDGVASIADNGTLTVAKAGVVTVKATREGNDNYAAAHVYATLTVKAPDNDSVSFDSDTVNYVLDESGVASSKSAIKANAEDNGAFTYSLNNTDIGLSIDPTTGKITVNDYNKLAKAMGHSGNVDVTVTADKAAGTVTTQEWYYDHPLHWEQREITKEVYPAASATYKLMITYDTAPEFLTVCQITDPGTTGWYNAENPAIVTPIDTDKYSIALDTPDVFASSQQISTQGTDARYIYLKDETTKKISAGIEINLKVDTEKPDVSKMKIEYSELNLVEKIGFAVGFYNPTVTIKFTAEDVTSGIDHFDWTYTKEENVSTVNKESETQEIAVTTSGDVATASLTLPASEAEQLRGKISFTATDNANNVSEVKQDDYVVVVDTIDPTKVVTFTSPDLTLDNHHYFTGDATFTFTVNEANFYEEDVAVKVSKNGGEPYEVTPSWVHNSADEHIGTYTLTEDGDYVIYMNYTDKTGNEMIPYQSDVITIDTTKPVVKLDYVHEGNVQKTVFTVKEHNFRPSDVVISGTMKDISGTSDAFTPESLTALLQSANWTSTAQDTYTYEYDGYIDGIYNLKMDYKDILGWDAESFVADQFTIDHSAPTGVSIEIVTTPIDTVLGAASFGFYDQDVTVKFTAYDNISGVKSFSWNYIKENGASDVNRPSDAAPTTVDAVQDATDKSKYTATITLPNTEVTQLRGYLAAYATDKIGNDSNKVTDSSNVIIVDTIAPEVKVEYSKANRTIGRKAYYNGKVDAAITVEESNFYSEDVIVKASKNGGTATIISPTWTDATVDKHIGRFTLSEDGHYIISVEYKDKSGNFDAKKSAYTSHEITIDTVKPIIKVDYKNTSVINTLVDMENHKRKYFDDTQTAVVTITEHNFNANDVDFMISAKDVSGKKLDAAALYNKTAWSVDSTGDVHTITITYPGDANYTFDVVYNDLASNAAKDYAADYFTVDKTKPKNLTVHYSTSILDTVLESITFGFYNAKMTVTLTAEDDTSEVHSFLYSYLNAAGVSSVNAEHINQALNAADIKYSKDRKTATVTFEIPKKILKNDNQFNGSVKFKATDRSGNGSDTYKETKRIVVDNIAPTVKVSYNEATNTVGDISYFNGNIHATVTINEANFYANDVQVMVSKDGGAATIVTPNWKNNSVDVHVGTFTLTEDGDYIVTINYKDKSSNAMTTYTSKQMTIDTNIEAPTYSINGVARTNEGGAYKGEATIAFNFEDQNFDTNTIKLTRTRFDAVEDVTEKFIKISDKEKGGSGSFTIPSKVENDGIYVLNVGMSDRANHTTESQIKFTINRFGSVYEYSDYLVSLIKDGGQYITIDGDNKEAITQDLVITEFNANQILADSLKILITRDGETIDAKYRTSPEIDRNAGIGESGWYQYVYTIDQENFVEDGVYKITLASAYSASDSEKNDSTSVPENSVDTKGNQILDTLNFTVDTTAPEIRNIVNLDKAIVNAQSLNVKYTVVDVGGLKTVEVVLNGQTIDTITDFGDSAYHYTGQFTIDESNDKQTVQIKVTDFAGNVTDTASEDFSTNDLYVFNDTITVSTNFFVRWFANKPLFWGSIGGVIVLIGAIWYIIVLKHKKKEEEEN